MFKHLRFDIFQLQETKLPVRLINITNVRRLVQGHETIPLRVKGDIKDASSERDNGSCGNLVVELEACVTRVQDLVLLKTLSAEGLVREREKVSITLNYKATRGLLATNLVILSLGEVMGRHPIAVTTSPTTRGLLATDDVIWNHSQVTSTTPELVPALHYYYHYTPREDVSALNRFNVHRCPTWRAFSGTGLELVTSLPRVRDLNH
ncbi:hypothetical protein TNCV_1583421 [Trichonephila clavipes]|nr:hypothetical protein TNCV_1583421 [Trichonephila clavipes]